MVNSKNVSQYAGTPPASDDAPRGISSGPIYAAKDVLRLLEDADNVEPWTAEVIEAVAKLELDANELRDLVRDALLKGKFKGSQWCRQSKKNRNWCAADSYVLRRKEWNKYANKELECEYYVKFAISKTGSLVLLVSGHL